MNKINIAEKNGQWKGDEVKYGALHLWVRSRKQKPDSCEDCNQKKSLDLANKNGNYTRNLDNWSWLCRKCHMISDGRLKRLILNSNNSLGKKQSLEHVQNRVSSRKNGAGYSQPKGYVNGRYIWVKKSDTETT